MDKLIIFEACSVRTSSCWIDDKPKERKKKKEDESMMGAVGRVCTFDLTQSETKGRLDIDFKAEFLQVSFTNSKRVTSADARRCHLFGQNLRRTNYLQ